MRIGFTSWRTVPPLFPPCRALISALDRDAQQPFCYASIVERTFGWLNRSRRLRKDFEALPETTETWISIAMIHLMVRRLAARA